jgi:hypothetical protein
VALLANNIASFEPVCVKDSVLMLALVDGFPDASQLSKKKLLYPRGEFRVLILLITLAGFGLAGCVI